jgi:hypothetical protein
VSVLAYVKAQVVWITCITPAGWRRSELVIWTKWRHVVPLSSWISGEECIPPPSSTGSEVLDWNASLLDVEDLEVAEPDEKVEVADTESLLEEADRVLKAPIGELLPQTEAVPQFRQIIAL